MMSPSWVNCETKRSTYCMSTELPDLTAASSLATAAPSSVLTWSFVTSKPPCFAYICSSASIAFCVSGKYSCRVIVNSFIPLNLSAAIGGKVPIGPDEAAVVVTLLPHCRSGQWCPPLPHWLRALLLRLPRCPAGAVATAGAVVAAAEAVVGAAAAVVGCRAGSGGGFRCVGCLTATARRENGDRRTCRDAAQETAPCQLRIPQCLIRHARYLHNH